MRRCPTGGFNTGGLADLDSEYQRERAAGDQHSFDHRNPAGERRAAGHDAPSARPIRRATPTRLRSPCTTRWARLTRSPCTSSRAPTANDWSVQTYIDGNAVGTPQDLQYSNTGALTNPANGQIPLPAYTPATGAADMNITLNLANTQQTGDTFAVTAVQQNGFTVGTLTGINIDSTGVVQATFTNGRSVDLGQVAMANFANNQGLQQMGNASWSQTTASGSVVQGVAGGSGFGTDPVRRRWRNRTSTPPPPWST